VLNSLAISFANLASQDDLLAMIILSCSTPSSKPSLLKSKASPLFLPYYPPWRPILQNLAFPQHQNLVIVHDRVQSMGHRKNGSIHKKALLHCGAYYQNVVLVRVPSSGTSVSHVDSPSTATASTKSSNRTQKEHRRWRKKTALPTGLKRSDVWVKVEVGSELKMDQTLSGLAQKVQQETGAKKRRDVVP
jgi:hypothetical protein